MDDQYLVFDLETVGQPYDSFDEAQREYLVRYTQTDEERAKKIDELALSPVTGRIICIGMKSVKKADDGYKERMVAYSVDPAMDDSAERREEPLASGTT